MNKTNSAGEGTKRLAEKLVAQWEASRGANIFAPDRANLVHGITDLVDTSRRQGAEAERERVKQRTEAILFSEEEVEESEYNTAWNNALGEVLWKILPDTDSPPDEEAST